MRRRHLLAIVLLLVAGFTTPAGAQRDRFVVATTWLAQHLSDSDLVLLHVGDPADYAIHHVRGARLVSLQDVSVSDRGGQGLTLEMPSAEDLRTRLVALGISDSSRIVVCFGGTWVSPATRVLFTLDYAGLGDRAALLDGGLPAWIAEGRPVTIDVPAPRKGALSPLRIQPVVVTADYVRSHLQGAGMSVVDARAPAFYRGEQTGGPQDARHRTGHIAGARSVPYGEITDEQQRLRPADALAALFAKAGVGPHDTIIGYCHVGQQATLMLLAARTLGHPVLLYDGSFEDWSRHPDYPVENPSKGSGR